MLAKQPLTVQTDIGEESWRNKIPLQAMSEQIQSKML